MYTKLVIYIEYSLYSVHLVQGGPDLPKVGVVDRNTKHPRSERRDPHSFREIQLAEDEPEQEVVPGQDGDCEVGLSEDSGHLTNEKGAL